MFRNCIWCPKTFSTLKTFLEFKNFFNVQKLSTVTINFRDIQKLYSDIQKLFQCSETFYGNQKLLRHSKAVLQHSKTLTTFKNFGDIQKLLATFKTQKSASFRCSAAAQTVVCETRQNHLETMSGPS